MNETTKRDQISFALTLPAVLDIRAAARLAAQLLEGSGQSIVIDASQVVQGGALCFQVLVSAQRTLARDGLSLTLVGPSPAFMEALERFGIPAEKIGELEPAR